MTDHHVKDTGEIGRGTARLASASAVRTVLSIGLSAVTAAVVAHALGASSFGLYAGGTAAFYLGIQLTDLGFASVLARELSTNPGQEGRLLRAMVQVQFMWSVMIALGICGLGIVSGGTRGAVMLVMSPAVAISGLSSARQIFTARFHARPLLVLDIASTLVQTAALTALAVIGVGPVPIAVALGASISINVVFASALGHRLVDSARPRRGDRARMFRMALPVGIASVLASLYFTVSVVLLGWLVSSRALGQYAAAVRFLTALVAIPSFVASAGIPGLARSVGDREELSRFAGTLSHWLAAIALPLAVGLAVFARPVVLLVFGHDYAGSIPLLRVLMVAGVLSLITNVLGIVLISTGIVRTIKYVAAFSLVVIVTGNLTLVPHFGVMASAWLTTLPEVIVITYGVFALRERLRYGVMLRRVWRPALAVVAGAGVGMALGPSEPYALPLTLVAFVGAIVLVRGWPAEFLPARLRWIATPEPES